MGAVTKLCESFVRKRMPGTIRRAVSPVKYDPPAERPEPEGKARAENDIACRIVGRRAGGIDHA